MQWFFIYDYTNGGKDEQSFDWALLFVATQAGEELGAPMFDEDGNQITKNYEENVQKDQTLEVAIALTLVNTTDDVSIVFSDFDNHEYTQTVKLSGSSGKDSSPEETGPEEAGSYQLYEMTFEGDVFDHDFLETSGFELYTMELSSDGIGWLQIDGRGSLTWGDGKIILDGSDAVYTYTYKDGMIVLEDSTGESMTFQKTGAAGVSGGLKPVDGSSSGVELTAYQQYWSGDWYGWTAYSNGTNDYSSLDGFYMDCMARIEVDENGEGTILLWDEATSVGNPRAYVSIQISDGGFEQGRLKSVSSWFSDGDVEDAD